MTYIDTAREFLGWMAFVVILIVLVIKASEKVAEFIVWFATKVISEMNDPHGVLE